MVYFQNKTAWKHQSEAESGDQRLLLSDYSPMGQAAAVDMAQAEGGWGREGPSLSPHFD